VKLNKISSAKKNEATASKIINDILSSGINARLYGISMHENINMMVM
jgi:hypothetical protein